MKEKMEELLNVLKANKGTVIRVAGVALGAAIGLTVAAMVVAAQDASFDDDELGAVDLDEEPDDEPE